LIDENLHPEQREVFERYRSHLKGLAYRMTGSLADAEDVLQEAYLRWHATDIADVENPKAFLSKMVLRLCLDLQKSARARRESYVGTWLPEPVLDEKSLTLDAASEVAHDVSVALLLALERLSPLERAAFILHDVFDVGYEEIAQTLERSEQTCRQLATRAREHVKLARPRYRPSREEQERVVMAFGIAAATGNTDPLANVLADDAVLYSDGGGRVLSALLPIFGKHKVLRFLTGVRRKFPLPTSLRVFQREINGMPGLVLESEGKVIQTFVFEFADAQVTAIYSVRNPEKLKHIQVEKLADD
jgi:RNA polymerase sigma-70 factor (ECF subfamily)